MIFQYYNHLKVGAKFYFYTQGKWEPVEIVRLWKGDEEMPVVNLKFPNKKDVTQMYWWETICHNCVQEIPAIHSRYPR